MRKLLWLPVKVVFLLNTWCNESIYITTGLEIKPFARMHLKLELSVNEKFVVAYETMVKVLFSCTKACYLIQNLELLFKRVHLSQYFGNNVFFHNLICWRYESSKIKVQYATHSFCCVWDTKSLKPSFEKCPNMDIFVVRIWTLFTQCKTFL